MRICNFIVKLVVLSSIALLFSSISEANEYVITKGSVDQCVPSILRAPTNFPEKAQSSGAGGEVYVKVLLVDGRVFESRLARSSGYTLLDSSAVESVRKDWEFDVSHCKVNSLPISTVVNVHYVRVPKSISFSSERRRVATETMKAANDRCTITPTSRKEQLVACVQ
jgi:TonB family protein